MAVIKCPNCGANNLDTGKGVRCEYCSSYLETSTPEPVIKEKNPNVLSIPIPNFSEIPVIGKLFKPQQPQNTSAGTYDPWADSANQNRAQKKYPYLAPDVKKDFSVEEATRTPPHKNRKTILSIMIPIIFVFICIAIPILSMKDDKDEVLNTGVVVDYNVTVVSRIVNIKNDIITYELEMEFDVNNTYDYYKDVSIMYEVYSDKHYIAIFTANESVKNGRSKQVVRKQLTSTKKPTRIEIIQVSYD